MDPRWCNGPKNHRTFHGLEPMSEMTSPCKSTKLVVSWTEMHGPAIPGNNHSPHWNTGSLLQQKKKQFWSSVHWSLFRSQLNYPCLKSRGKTSCAVMSKVTGSLHSKKDIWNTKLLDQSQTNQTSMLMYFLGNNESPQDGDLYLCV